MTAAWHGGDRLVKAGSRELRLRLTVGALAEIDSRLGIQGPVALSERMRSLGPDDLDHMLCALLRPVHGEGAPALARSVPPVQASRAIADLFEEAFS